MVGSTASEIIGKSDFHIFDEGSAVQTRNWDRKVIEAKTSLTYHDISSAGNITHIYHSTKTPLLDSAGSVVAILGVSRVVKQVSHKPTRELSSVIDYSHELRTPLTVLQSVIDLESNDLAEGIVRLPEFRSKLLKNANLSIQRIIRLIDSVKL